MRAHDQGKAARSSTAALESQCSATPFQLNSMPGYNQTAIQRQAGVILVGQAVQLSRTHNGQELCSEAYAEPNAFDMHVLAQVRQRPLTHVAAQPAVQRRVCRCSANRLSRRRCRSCSCRAQGYASCELLSRTWRLPWLWLWDCARGWRSRRDAVSVAGHSSWRGKSLLVLDGFFGRGQDAKECRQADVQRHGEMASDLLTTCRMLMQLPAAHAWRAWLAADRAQRDAPPDAAVHALMTALSQAIAFVSRHG